MYEIETCSTLFLQMPWHQYVSGHQQAKQNKTFSKLSAHELLLIYIFIDQGPNWCQRFKKKISSTSCVRINKFLFQISLSSFRSLRGIYQCLYKVACKQSGDGVMHICHTVDKGSVCEYWSGICQLHHWYSGVFIMIVFELTQSVIWLIDCIFEITLIFVYDI